MTCPRMKLLFAKKIAYLFKLFTYVENSYLNADVCKFESSQKDESRAHSADTSNV